MKCIDNYIGKLFVFILLAALLAGCASASEQETALQQYEKTKYNQSLFSGTFIAENYCVAKDNVSLKGFEDDTLVDGIGLYDLNGQKVLYSYQAHEQVYPASITKIMTALLVLEHGNLQDSFTISSTADSSNLSIYAQSCGIKEGDVWKVEDLLNALLIYSGNDVALALAEYVGGSVDAFVKMMNQRAYELSATNTHFVNPHGLHDDQHYTTVYDLYLIFNECIKDQRFVDIIKKESCTLTYTTASGTSNTVTYTPTNLYASGDAEKPKNVTVIGGKTGTNDDYSRCLILLTESAEKNPYISVVIGAPDKTILYNDMTALIEAIP